ncbi:MAG: hypothetical protein ABSH53_07120 [Holophaga sp.]|jgi:hypothetical protein
MKRNLWRGLFGLLLAAVLAVVWGRAGRWSRTGSWTGEEPASRAALIATQGR